MTDRARRALRISRHPATLLAALGLLTGIASPARAADVVINEFSRALMGGGLVEVHNTRPDTTFDLSGWTLVNGEGTVVALSGLLGPGDYKDFPASNFVLEGGQIELYDGALLQRDEVSFGDEGGAPLPPPVGNYSCGRSPDGIDTGDHAADWNLDPTPTFAAPNDHLSASLGLSDMRINEAGRDPFLPAGRGGGCPVTPVVELHNVSGAPLDLSGWWLTDGRVVATLDGFVGPFGYFIQADFPAAFCFELSGVLYLFDPMGRRFDQVGIRGASLPGPLASFQKVPDGAPPYDGFDYVSSGGSATWVIKAHTFGTTNGEPGTPVGEVESRSWGSTKAGWR